MTRVAILTLDGFNEIDSFVAFHILRRAEGVDAVLCGPDPEPVSMNGVPVKVSGTMQDVAVADAVVIGSGQRTRDFAADHAFMTSLRLEPNRQFIASQCSGALILAEKGLLHGSSVATDDKTRPWIEERGFQVVLESLRVTGRIATAGGCLSGVYLAAWLLCRFVGENGTRDALSYVAPVGEAAEFIENALSVVKSADQRKSYQAAFDESDSVPA